ncbi:hypothetical protein CPter91_4068 [Collimonas pratensis]|uniref:Uncharacterized protein n=1 Tax=Collimonas pratensis TaxID=279113 RepID=A0A127Q8M0_9BURK|nr:hypothetical protein CPter91_4068 [Collimonas pratensis]
MPSLDHLGGPAQVAVKRRQRNRPRSSAERSWRSAGGSKGMPGRILARGNN